MSARQVLIYVVCVLAFLWSPQHLWAAAVGV